MTAQGKAGPFPGVAEGGTAWWAWPGRLGSGPWEHRGSQGMRTPLPERAGTHQGQGGCSVSPRKPRQQKAEGTRWQRTPPTPTALLPAPSLPNTQYVLPPSPETNQCPGWAYVSLSCDAGLGGSWDALREHRTLVLKLEDLQP